MTPLSEEHSGYCINLCHAMPWPYRGSLFSRDILLTKLLCHHLRLSRSRGIGSLIAPNATPQHAAPCREEPPWWLQPAGAPRCPLRSGHHSHVLPEAAPLWPLPRIAEVERVLDCARSVRGAFPPRLKALQQPRLLATICVECARKEPARAPDAWRPSAAPIHDECWHRHRVV